MMIPPISGRLASRRSCCCPEMRITTKKQKWFAMTRATAALMVIALVNAGLAHGSTIAFWNFNSGTNATTGTFSASTLDVTDGNGSLTFSNGTTGLVVFGGTVTNLPDPDPDGTGRGVALAIQNGDVGANNGSFLQINLDMTGLQDLGMSFAAQRTNNGFNAIDVSYAVGAGSYTSFFAVPTLESSMGTTSAVPASIRTVDFTSINGLIADQDDVRIRMTFSGGSTTASAGNNRFDNLTFTANPVPEPSTVVLAAVGVGLVGFVARRRQRYKA
jgi:hypothetical protein